MEIGFLSSGVFWAAVAGMAALASVVISWLSYRRARLATDDRADALARLHVAMQSIEDLREKREADLARLEAIDPERFIDRVNELNGKYEELEEEARKFTEAQTEAFGKAAEILTEQRIWDSDTEDAEAAKLALADAKRFAEIARAADPSNKRLVELEKLADSRSAGVEAGEPIETLNWEGMSDVELNRLSIALGGAGEYRLAEIAARRSVPLARLRTGEKSINFAGALSQHVSCLRDLGAIAEAEPLSRDVLELTRALLGPTHPDYSKRLNTLALLLEATGRYQEAEPLHREALEVIRTELGTSNPDYAWILASLAGLLTATDRYQQAEPLYREALEVMRATLGTEPLNYAGCLNNFAVLLHATDRAEEAESVARQAVEVVEGALGADHPLTNAYRDNHAAMMPGMPET